MKGRERNKVQGLGRGRKLDLKQAEEFILKETIFLFPSEKGGAKEYLYRWVCSFRTKI